MATVHTVTCNVLTGNDINLAMMMSNRRWIGEYKQVKPTYATHTITDPRLAVCEAYYINCTLYHCIMLYPA